MTSIKSTKRALITSALAILMCAAMLIGTTFAWFTDTASTGVNKIQAGNLDVELEYSKDFTEWKKVNDTTKVFEDSTLWEPGRTEVVYLRVKNAGTLALKYTLGIYNLYNSTGKNVLGNKYSLSDYVKLGAAEADAAYADRAAAISAVQDSAKTLNSIGDTGVVGADLATNTTKVYAMVLYMPTEVGNEANPKNNDPYWAAKVSFGISVSATQAMSESDSFDNTYDKDAATILSAIAFLPESTKSPKICRRTDALAQYRLKEQLSLQSMPMYMPCTIGMRAALPAEPWLFAPTETARLSSMAVISVRSVYLPTTLYAI